MFVIRYNTLKIAKMEATKTTTEEDRATRFITPTKQRPVFQAWNTYSGYVVNPGVWKEWEFRREDGHLVGGETTATSLAGAIEALFKYIQAQKRWLNDEQKFEIYMIDGTPDPNNQGSAKLIPCYKISIRQAKKYKVI